MRGIATLFGIADAALAAVALMVAMLVAFSAPAMANNQNERNVQHSDSNVFNDRGDNCCRDFDLDDEVLFSGFFFPLVSEVDFDVDTRNVGPRNDNEGDCIVRGTDLDLDGFIAECEIDLLCFV